MSPMRKQVGVGEGACRAEHGNWEWGLTSHSSTGVSEVTALPVRPVCFIKRGREHYHTWVIHLEDSAQTPRVCCGSIGNHTFNLVRGSADVPHEGPHHPYLWARRSAGLRRSYSALLLRWEGSWPARE